MGLFFKLPKHYVFDYKPIYYDPKKEEREKRFRKIRKQMGVKDENDDKHEYKADIDFRRAGKIGRTKTDKSSTIRLLVILVFLVVFFYIFLFTDIFDLFASYFMK